MLLKQKRKLVGGIFFIYFLFCIRIFINCRTHIVFERVPARHLDFGD